MQMWENDGTLGTGSDLQRLRQMTARWAQVQTCKGYVTWVTGYATTKQRHR
jgi:hypothetical protein